MLQFHADVISMEYNTFMHHYSFYNGRLVSLLLLKRCGFIKKNIFTIYISLTCYPTNNFVYFPSIYSKA